MSDNTLKQLLISLIKSTGVQKSNYISLFDKAFRLETQQLRDRKLNSGMTCPKSCNNPTIILYGHPTGDRSRQRYRCKNCGVTFNDYSGTLFHNKKLRHHLIPFLEMMLNGDSVRRTADQLKVSPTTVNAWRQSLLRYIETNSHLFMPTLSEGIQESSCSEYKSSCKGKPANLVVPEGTCIITFKCDRLGHASVTLHFQKGRKPRNEHNEGEALIVSNRKHPTIASTATRSLFHTRNVESIRANFALAYQRMRGVAHHNLKRYALWNCLLLTLNKLRPKARLEELQSLCL